VKLNSTLNKQNCRETSSKSFSMFMLFSIVVCCVSSVVSCFANVGENFHPLEISSSFSSDYLKFRNCGLSQSGLDKLFSDLESDSKLTFARRAAKREFESNSNKPFFTFEMPKYGWDVFTSFSIEIKRQEKINKNTVTENIGISERFQV